LEHGALNMKITGLMLALLLSTFSMALCQEEVPEDSARTDTVSTSGKVKRDRFIEPVTAHEVRRFLDPTRMINRIEYNLRIIDLPLNSAFYSHGLRPWIALNNRHAVAITIPYLHFSALDGDRSSGVGDGSASWGFVLRENLTSRWTTLAGRIEWVLPTGDFSRGTGLDTWILSPAILFVFNPTDMFPVNAIVKYNHSVGTIGDSQAEDFKVQSMEIVLQTFHILRRGFYLAFMPTYQWDMEREFDLFSIGLGGGYTFNRQLTLAARYVDHVTGRKSFSEIFHIGVKYLWGKDRGHAR
jgi:hypothetical protein